MTSPAHLAAAVQNNWLARDITRPALSADGPLAGLKFFAKDLFDVAGEITRAGSACFDNDPPAQGDAELVRRAGEAGASLLGTTNMDALAYGFVTNNPEYGRARHPLDDERLCGGSSGGSAAVVAAGLADFALGSDTSGSIRVPSAFCGVPGYKPSAGFLSDMGVAPLSPTFDRPGLFARDLATLTKVAGAIGDDRLTSKSLNRPEGGVPVKFGLLGGYFSQDADPAIQEAVLGFASQLGARTGLQVPGATAARASAYVLVAYEAAQIHAARLRERPERFDNETRQRLFAASLITEDCRQQAIAVQQDFTHRFNTLFDEFDFVLAPCVPFVAPLASELEVSDPGKLPLRASLGLYTQPITLVGCPVVSIPLSTNVGLPTALQLIGPVGSDPALLEVAQEIAPSLAG